MTLVRANPELSAGSLAVLSRSFSSDQEGTLIYNCQYVCLQQFAKENAKKFKIKSNPPTPILEEILTLSLARVPLLTSVEISTENGLTYFNAVYISEIISEIVVTSSSSFAVFSASYSKTDQEGETIVETLSFRFISPTITVASTNTFAEPQYVRPSKIFDVRGSLSEGKYNWQQIISRSKTRSSRGAFSYTTTTTGMYSSDKGGIVDTGIIEV